jgi:hypothetical protein
MEVTTEKTELPGAALHLVQHFPAHLDVMLCTATLVDSLVDLKLQARLRHVAAAGVRLASPSSIGTAHCRPAACCTPGSIFSHSCAAAHTPLLRQMMTAV